MTAAPVVPVMVINKLEQAVPLARALVDGGLKVLEITLRTDCAMDAIERMLAEVDDAIIGAGTVTNVSQLRDLKAMGAHFAISPGATDRLLDAGQTLQLPYLPAIATVSEMMRAMEHGYGAFKFFPASVNGGVPALKSIGAVFPDVSFCPTGGISEKDYRDYLALPNVKCVGGSWVAPADAMDAGDWGRITDLARKAVEGARG